MQAARIVFLDDEAGCASHRFGQRFAAFWFSRFSKIALRLVLGKSHGFKLSTDPPTPTSFA
jgi:hypothetical protein